jgi:hypothetical protein
MLLRQRVPLFFIAAFVFSLSQTTWAEELTQKNSTEKTVIWTTGSALMPAWGFYPNASAYGGTKPFGGVSAWIVGTKGEHIITWVADFPTSGIYHTWTRQYGGYGRFKVSVDEKDAGGWTSNKGADRYVWQYHGKQMISEGKHHVDISVSLGMLDAVLFSLDANFDPEKDKLPPPVQEPALRALRQYREDSYLKAFAGEAGFVVGKVTPYTEVLYDWLPKQDEIIDRLKLWGAPNQYISGSFCVRALEEANELKVILPELVGPGNTKLDGSKIDVRVVYVRKRMTDLFERTEIIKIIYPVTLVPELLVYDDRTPLPPRGRQGGFGRGVCTTRIPLHESRQFWLTVHIPEGSPPGVYKGNLLFDVTDSAKRYVSLPVEIEILAVDLQGAEGYYSIFYPSQPDRTDVKHHVTAERYLAELKDQVRHGLNTTSLYGRFNSISFVKEAGMTKPPCIMMWPENQDFNWVDAAKKIGLGGLLFYGVDEPRTPENIEKCKREALRRQKSGLSMLTAIDRREAQLSTRDVIDYPVYNIYVFSGRDNEAVMYARKKGFNPVSYWMASTPFPLHYRALTGLYNKACGYVGSMPWSYQDFSDNSLYDPDKIIYKVTYPDEYGEPIPTLCWEAHRDGIDDVRYLEALDRAIAKAQERAGQPGAPAELAKAIQDAQEVRKKYFESIQGRWFEYLCGLQPGELENIRRAFADAIIVLNRFSDKKETRKSGDNKKL